MKIMPTEPQTFRHTAKIPLDEQMLVRLLGLPNGMRVLRFDHRQDPLTTWVIVEDPMRLPPTPNWSEAPIVRMSHTAVVGDDGSLVSETEYHWPTYADVWGDDDHGPGEMATKSAWPDDTAEDQAAYDDWKHEVKQGDTTLGFRAWQKGRSTDGS